MTTAFWERLDAAGHDAARLTENGPGYVLTGTAVFRHYASPACLCYSVTIETDWSTRQCRVWGFVGEREVNHRIERTKDGWMLNDLAQNGLEHLQDLDLGFTPATNLQQLRRLRLGVGEESCLSVAWLDVDATSLICLPQKYRRVELNRYVYEAPTVSYEGTLEVDETGFVRVYPGLWRMCELGY